MGWWRSLVRQLRAQKGKQERELGSDAVDYAGRVGSATGRFVSAHALPLGLVATGLAWLGVSIRRESRRIAVPRQRALANSPRRQLEVDARVRARTPAPIQSTATTKLMGVRTSAQRDALRDY
ncbi:MAG TPA: hypothetical protein VFX59_09720 [Polyangiales bacterium]|nr:hypothetical protein [Polyangiales bacterium]